MVSGVLTGIAEKLLKHFDYYAIPGPANRQLPPVATAAREELQERLHELRLEVIDNLTIGIAGGKSVSKQQKREVSVETRSGAAQVIVNSRTHDNPWVEIRPAPS